MNGVGFDHIFQVHEYPRLGAVETILGEDNVIGYIDRDMHGLAIGIRQKHKIAQLRGLCYAVVIICKCLTRELHVAEAVVGLCVEGIESRPETILLRCLRIGGWEGVIVKMSAYEIGQKVYDAHIQAAFHVL